MELKRNILEYERITGRKLFELRRLFNSAILEGGAKRKREDDSQEVSSKKTRNETTIVFKTASGVDKVISNLAKLESLHLSSNQLTSIPPDIGNLTKLENLFLDSNQLSTLPPEIGNLAILKSLHLDNNQLTTLPPEIGNLAKLESLHLTSNQLTSIPPEIGNLAKLFDLHLDSNQLSTLPPEIGNLAKLVDLRLEYNQLTTLPPEIGNLAKLESLYLTSNQLTSIPHEIGNLAKLEILYLSNNPIQGAIPDTFQQLHELSEIDLENTDITNVDALRPLLHNHSLAQDGIYMNRNRPDWLGENTQQQIVGRAYEVHNAFKRVYPHFLQNVFAPAVQQTVHNKDTAKIQVGDSLRSAIDNAKYLADTLTDETYLRQDTKTIKETLKEKLEDLKGKVGKATLNSIPNYNNVVQALLRYMVALRNERITREYLSRFIDESLHAYGRNRTSCMAGVRERLTILFPEALRTAHQSWNSSEQFPVSNEILRGADICVAIKAATESVSVSQKAYLWTQADSPATKEAAVAWIADSIVKGTIGDATDSVVKAVENAVLETINGMDTNFNCKDREEIFTDPKDCEEK